MQGGKQDRHNYSCFQFPSSFQLRPSLGKLSAARSIAFRVLVQASQASQASDVLRRETSRRIAACPIFHSFQRILQPRRPLQRWRAWLIQARACPAKKPKKLLSKLVNLRTARRTISDARTATYVISLLGSGPGGRWFKSNRPDHFF